MPLGMAVGLGAGHIVLYGGVSPLSCQLSSPKRGHSYRNFWPMSIVAKRSPISATAEHLWPRLLYNRVDFVPLFSVILKNFAEIGTARLLMLAKGSEEVLRMLKWASLLRSQDNESIFLNVLWVKRATQCVSWWCGEVQQMYWLTTKIYRCTD